MKINKTQLQQAISVVKPGLSNKELFEQTTSFVFLGGRVVTYNDEISISCPVEGVDFEGAIKAEELYELLTRITKDEIDITIGDGELLVLSGRMKAGLKMEPEIKLPIKESGKMHKLPDPENFNLFLGMCMNTCSTDLTQPRLACVNVREDGIMVASDGYRLVHCVGAPSPVKEFLLPATSAFEVLKTHPTQISLDKGWVHFGNDKGVVVSCRRLDDDFVPYDKIEEVLEVDVKSKINFPSSIEEMINRVKQFAKRDFVLDEIVRVKIEGGKILLRAEADGTRSWIEEKATIDCKETIEFLITPSMFEDILKMTRSFTFDKSGTKMKFEGENWEYVIMLRAK